MGSFLMGKSRDRNAEGMIQTGNGEMQQAHGGRAHGVTTERGTPVSTCEKEASQLIQSNATEICCGKINKRGYEGFN